MARMPGRDDLNQSNAKARAGHDRKLWSGQFEDVAYEHRQVAHIQPL
jgi:hypothetical protein